MFSAKLILTCILLYLFQDTHGICPQHNNFVEQSFFIEKNIKDNNNKKTRISIKRFVRKQGAPLIISHAFMLNNIAYQELGFALWKKGFDVWLPNMRGHGNGSHRSIVSPYEPGDYGFDSIVTEDLPILIEYISKETEKKIHIVGHSIGGITWEQYLSGVIKDAEGSIRQEDSQAFSRANQVATFTAITTPPNFIEITPKVKIILFTLSPFIHHRHAFIPLTINKSPNEPTHYGIKRTFRNLFSWMIQPVFPYIFPDGILDFENIDKDKNELDHIIKEGMSSPHTDILADFIRWFSDENSYFSRDGNVNYAITKKIYLPSLSLASSNDTLAPANQIAASLKHYPKGFARKIKIYSTYSHVDIVFKKARKNLVESISSFIKNHSE